MNGQWGVAIGAALGASGAVVGALATWASARLQARAQLNVARLQRIAQHDAETIAAKRASYSALVLSVDAARRQMRIVQQHVQAPRAAEGDLKRKRAEVHDRIREMQAAEWTLRVMLSAEEQAAVTELIDAVYATHQALIADVEAWIEEEQSDAPREPGQTRRYAVAARDVQAQLMRFAGTAHERLYGQQLLGLPVTAQGRPR